MSDNNQDFPEPDENAGLNEYRLDAERTRDELEATLNEIERRISPRRLVAAAKRTWRSYPAEVAAVVGIVGSIGGLIVLAARGRAGRP